MIIEFASEVSNLAWRVSQSQNGGAIFARTKWSPMFGSVVFDYQWCILIVMSVKGSFYNEYDIKNNEKPVFWAQRSFQNHHQTFHDRCPEKIGPLPKKSDHWSTRTCPENIRPAPTWLYIILLVFSLCFIHYVICVFPYCIINLMTMICICIDAVYWFHFVTGIGIEGSGIVIVIVSSGTSSGCTEMESSEAETHLASTPPWRFLCFASALARSCSYKSQVQSFQIVQLKQSFPLAQVCIARTWHQPNYPNQLAPKRGSQSSLILDPNPMWWANGGNLSIVQTGDTLSRRSYQPIVLASLWSRLWSPAAN